MMIEYRISSPFEADQHYKLVSACSNKFVAIGLGLLEILIRFKAHKSLLDRLYNLLPSRLETAINQLPQYTEDLNFLKTVYKAIKKYKSKAEAQNYLQVLVNKSSENLSRSLSIFLENLASKSSNAIIDSLSKDLEICISYNTYPRFSNNNGPIISVRERNNKCYLLYHRDEIEVDQTYDTDINLSRFPFYQHRIEDHKQKVKINHVPSLNSLVRSENPDAVTSINIKNFTDYHEANRFKEGRSINLENSYLNLSSIQKNCLTCKFSKSVCHFTVNCMNSCEICNSCRAINSENCRICSRNYEQNEHVALKLIQLSSRSLK